MCQPTETNLLDNPNRTLLMQVGMVWLAVVVIYIRLLGFTRVARLLGLRMV